LLGDRSLDIGSDALKRLLLGEDISRAASSGHVRDTFFTRVEMQCP
jgi:hypothetical protein